jgi:hypothetical protein
LESSLEIRGIDFLVYFYYICINQLIWKRKRIKTNSFRNYNVVFGSINNKHSKAVYINISAWAEPQHNEQIAYTRVIKDINKKS